MKHFLTACLIACSVSAIAGEADNIYKKESKPMSFGACVTSVYNMTKAVPAKIIVSTDIFTLVRFQTSEGSLLASCSKPDQKIALVYTTNPF